MRQLTLLAMACALAWPAAARNADGTLGLIRLPNNGIPAVLTAGTAFDVQVEREAALRLVGAGTEVPLEAEWRPTPGGHVAATVTVPSETPAGTYALAAEAGGTADHNIRAVYVVEQMPETYVIGHITDTHIGSNRHARTSEAIMADVVAHLNASDADIVVVTGDITENGTVEQFQALLPLLDACEKPTFVCSGNHDRKDLNYEAFFGPDAYHFRFGPDAYLAWDTKDFYTSDELTPQNGDLVRFRRALDPARWTIGLSHRYEFNAGMRSQLAVFIDEPLDYLLAGHWHREFNGPTPWGHTHMHMTAAAINGYVRYFDVDGDGLRPREAERAATIE